MKGFVRILAKLASNLYINIIKIIFVSDKKEKYSIFDTEYDAKETAKTVIILILLLTLFWTPVNRVVFADAKNGYAIVNQSNKNNGKQIKEKEDNNTDEWMYSSVLFIFSPCM